MLNFARFKSRSLIGLDIQSDEIRLVQLSKTRQIKNAVFAKLPPGAIVDGKIYQIDAVKSVIKTLVQRTQTQGSPTALALPAHCVITKRIKLPPRLQEVEYEAEISHNLNHYLPGVSDELCFDFLLENLSSEALLVASRQELLNTYITVVQEAGLSAKVVDIDEYALIRAVYFCLEAPAREPIALLYFNERTLEFILFHQHEIIFSQYWRNEKQIAFIYQEELLQQLQCVLQQSFLLHRQLQISRLAIAGVMSEASILKEYLAKYNIALTIENINPFADASRFLIGLGLALRKMPQW